MELAKLISRPPRWYRSLRPLLALMMLCIGVSVYASNSKVTINVNNVTLASVLRDIEKQTDYSFSYSKESIDVSVPVTLTVKDEALTTVLDKLFAKQDISYKINKKQIVLNRKNADTARPSGTLVSKGNNIKVVGTVTDSKGEPLIGASITVEGQTKGVTTDIDGNYEISVPTGSQLTFSYIGYTPEKKKVNESGKLDISLAENTQLLSEVVVIGYGTMDKKELTSAISHVSEKDFLTISSADPSMLIQGKVAGVSITNTGSADPNNQASIQIRGVSSRSAGLGPLIVIDGVPGGSLTNINPNDIASFDVLKDGAASAIYGTRGSNGVILVTTKKGSKDGQIHTQYSAMFSWDKMNREIEMMNAQEYRDIRLGWNDTGMDYGYDTDWLGAVSRTGFAMKHSLSLSGGNERSNYRISLDYRDANGIDLRSRREEYGARASAMHTTKNGLLTFNVNVAPRVVYRDNSDWGVFATAMVINPTSPVMDPEDPSRYNNLLSQQMSNPVEALKLEKNHSDTKMLDWDANVRLNLLPLLMTGDTRHTLNTTLSFADHQYSNDNGWFRPSISTQAINSGRTGEASRSYESSRQYIVEWITNYTGHFNKHTVKAMAGYSFQYAQNSGLSAENKDFPNDGLGYDDLGSGELATKKGEVLLDSYRNDSKLIAFFGRVSYDFDGRYLFTASLRHEGSSKFGANHKWGNFPAVSAGWRISNEKFMEGTRHWLNDLKIRGDYGETGNQDFSSYLSLSTLEGFGYYFYRGKYYQVWGPGKNVNPDLRWEKGKNWNVGIDFSMFNNRFSGSLNYFSRRQQDLLGNYKVPVPPNLHDETFVNVGTMKNNGFEFDLNFNAVDTKDFGYNFNVIGTAMSNKFVDFSNSEFVGQDYYATAYTSGPYPDNYLQRIEKGESIGNFYLLRYAGFNESGNMLVYDRDGDIIRADQAQDADRAIVGNGMPKFTMSTSHYFRYRNFDLSLFFRGAFGFDLFNIHDYSYANRNFWGNRMKKAYGKNFEMTTLGSPFASDYYLESGDYFKLDMVTLGYSIDLSKTRFLDKIRVYGTVKNVFTLTKFSGIDPASYQTNGLTPGAQTDPSFYPTTRQFILGLTVDF